jgi:hypothetical protein
MHLHEQPGKMKSQQEEEEDRRRSTDVRVPAAM